VGAVHVGDDVAIGANCVVTDDVPDHAVVVGVPGRVISFEGSAGYVNRTDYPGSQQRAQVRDESSRATHVMVSASGRTEGEITPEEQDQADIRHCVQ
jgi:carbonic anhydrase/acetyltransferase-like protein (isoleucine patch superfamily)